MKYKDAIKLSMEYLAKDEKTIFIGYNVGFGSQGYGTLKGIPKEKKIETPLAENLMMGLAMGMALEGYRPIVFFERHDFMLNASDGIVNHLSKLEKMSKGQFNLPVIIRAVIGSKSPLYPGVQHIQDFTEAFEKMINFPIYRPANSAEIEKIYKEVKGLKKPVMIIEEKDLYEQE